MKKFLLTAAALAALSGAALASQRETYNPDGSLTYETIATPAVSTKALAVPTNSPTDLQMQVREGLNTPPDSIH